MKRILSLVLVLGLVLSVCSFTAAADSNPAIILTTKDKLNSGTVSATVVVQNLSAKSVTIDISFDTKIVKATGFSKLQEVGANSSVNSASNANGLGKFQYRMTATASVEEKFSDSGLLYLEFSVKDYASYDSSTIKITSVKVTGSSGAAIDCMVVNNNKVNHEHDDISNKWATTKQATCEESGTRVRHCNLCGAIAEMEVIPALEHNWNSGVITKKATCTKEGVLTYTCVNDKSHQKTEVIPALGHDFGEWKEGANGQEISVCKNDSGHTQIREKGSDKPIINIKDDDDEEFLSSSDEHGSSEDVGAGEDSVSGVTSEDTSSESEEIKYADPEDDGGATMLIIILAGGAVLGLAVFFINKRRF